MLKGVSPDPLKSSHPFPPIAPKQCKHFIGAARPPPLMVFLYKIRVFLYVLYCTNWSCAGHHGWWKKWDAASVQRLQRWGLLLTGFEFLGGGERSYPGEFLPKGKLLLYIFGTLTGWLKPLGIKKLLRFLLQCVSGFGG